MNLRRILKSLNYKNSEIEKLIKIYDLKEYTEERDNKIEILLYKLGFNEVQSMKILNSKMLKNTKKQTLYYEIIEKYFYFFKLELCIKDIIRITTVSSIIFIFPIDHIENNIEYFINLGFYEKEVLKFSVLFPTLLILNLSSIKEKIDGLITFGYTKKDILKMLKTSPNFLGGQLETLISKLNDLISYGYKKDSVIKMTITLPTLLSLSIENIKEKIDFYNEIGLHDLPNNNPKYLMQSVSLSYSRHMFLESLGLTIDMTNFTKLFYNEKQFSKQFGISKIELLQMYPYSKYKEEKTLKLTVN